MAACAMHASWRVCTAGGVHSMCFSRGALHPTPSHLSHLPFPTTGGVKALYAGLSPTLIRAFPANAAQWLAWELCMQQAKRLEGSG